MRAVFLTIITLLWGAAACVAAPRFDEANSKFNAGNIDGAAAIYQELLDSEGPSAAVLFNLGNCEQRLGQNGEAILAYDRARLLTPRDPDLLANLAMARKAAAVFEEPGQFPRLDAMLGYLSLDEWSWLVAGSALALGLLALLCGLMCLPRRVVRTVAALASLTLIAGSAALYQRRGEAHRAVVVAANAAVRLSPFQKAEVLGTTGEGRIVRLLGMEGAFRFVEVPGTGLRGWMAADDVKAIMPGR
jgi:hypothetical protein